MKLEIRLLGLTRISTLLQIVRKSMKRLWKVARNQGNHQAKYHRNLVDHLTSSPINSSINHPIFSLINHPINSLIVLVRWILGSWESMIAIKSIWRANG